VRFLVLLIHLKWHLNCFIARCRDIIYMWRRSYCTSWGNCMSHWWS